MPLWRGDHVAVKQLVEDFARYPYLPRLRSPTVLHEAVLDGLKLLTWETDTFAYADSYDETAGRYRGLRAVQGLPAAEAVPAGLLVKSAVAKQQMDAEIRSASPVTPAGATAGGSVSEGTAPAPC